MNNLKPTPETDAALVDHMPKDATKWSEHYLSLSIFARKLERERDEARALLTQCSAEREHNAMQALAHKADADAMREAIKEADTLLSTIGYLKEDLTRSKLQPFLNDKRVSTKCSLKSSS